MCVCVHMCVRRNPMICACDKHYKKRLIIESEMTKNWMPKAWTPRLGRLDLDACGMDANDGK